MNSYLFSILAQDDKVAYNFVRSRFWYDETNGRHSDRYPNWRVNSETVAPYIPERLLTLVNRLEASNSLTRQQKEEIKAFKEEFEAFVGDL